MLTFHPMVKAFIYLLTIVVSSFVWNQLGNALCLEDCLFQQILYIGFSNLIFLAGVVLLIGLSEKSISEWNEEE